MTPATPLPAEEDVVAAFVLMKVARFYEVTTGADVRRYINWTCLPHDVMFDPVAFYIEAMFADVEFVAGGRSVTIRYGGKERTAPVLEWHDLLLARVVNGMTSSDGDLHGYYNVDGQSGADVETLCGLLAVPPVHPFIALLRRVSSALLRAFRTVPEVTVTDSRQKGHWGE
jgi:hypothetical protein